MEIRDARSLPSIAQEDLRRKAVNAVLSGKKHTEVARIFAVARPTVSRWVKLHKACGTKALKAKKKGRPKGGRLKPWQAARIAKAVIDRNPRQLKLPFYLWTREAVAELIEKRYGLRLSIWTVGRYLARWGFTPQKPMRRAFEKNPEQVRRWLEKEYPAISKRARLEKAEIYWGAEMGLRSDHATGRSYELRGQTPVIQGTGQRFGCNMISAITNRGRLNFMVFKKRFRGDVFLDFLKRLIRQAKRKVFLIVDGHPVHRAVKIKQWIQKNAHGIRLYFLPGYSPELNPDEVLNQDVKSNAVGRRRPRNQEEMIKTVRGYLRSRQKTPHTVKNYFNEKHVRYAAA
ncbi:transposase [Candidatus Nitromaritima sp. SCGC AAA799-A02]|nr:transposase [Candidatus Nitromaritima sp. SCGC AAA799-A02]